MNPAALSDVMAMIEVREGNTAQFDGLVQRYRHDLVGYLNRMVDDHAAAEELAQEAFLRVYRSRARYQPTAKFTTWLYGIGVRLALNWLRDNRKHRQSESIDAPRADGRSRELRDPAPRAESELLRAEVTLAVRRALRSLPDRQRSVIVMHKYHDMTYEEIAASMKCSPQAVKSMLFRAHASLRERLLSGRDATLLAHRSVS
jgi:RNA polymerase sigma-70 factor (ECF subfamily)